MKITRNLGIELVRATEAAAMAAGRWMGRGDKEAADQAAVDAMRFVLGQVEMDAVVVIGEGEKDEAPMLYIGERVGTGGPPAVDIAVDPIDGTRPVALGMPGALSVVAGAPRGAFFHTRAVVYMEKLAVGPQARDAIDLTAPIETNLREVARAKKCDVEDLTVVVLDRPRHKELIERIRRAGARLKLILDGDVAGAIMTAIEGSGVDLLVGIGGAPEAVVAACALKALGGNLQCRPWPRNDEERRKAAEEGLDLEKVYTLDDLVRSDDGFFAATGITGGEILRGVRYYGWGAETDSVVMRIATGTVRFIRARHRWEKLMRISGIRYD